MPTETDGQRAARERRAQEPFMWLLPLVGLLSGALLVFAAGVLLGRTLGH